MEELDREKLSPLLKLKYNNAIADSIADLGGNVVRRVPKAPLPASCVNAIALLSIIYNHNFKLLQFEKLKTRQAALVVPSGCANAGGAVQLEAALDWGGQANSLPKVAK